MRDEHNVHLHDIVLNPVIILSHSIVLQNEAAFDEVFQHANFNTFLFRNRVKLETYNVSQNFIYI